MNSLTSQVGPRRAPRLARRTFLALLAATPLARYLPTIPEPEPEPEPEPRFLVRDEQDRWFLVRDEQGSIVSAIVQQGDVASVSFRADTFIVAK